MRGKYRDVILPMTVLRRLDAVLEETKQEVAEYETDPDLRDLEQIPLQEAGGIDGFLQREVLPYAADAWYQPASARSATRSASPATSTARRRCAP